MQDVKKTKTQLLREFSDLRQGLSRLDKTESESKTSEIELRILDYAIASSINGIGITDIGGKVIYVNDSLIKMWGYTSKDEILGRDLLEFWEGDGIQKTILALRKKGGRVGEDTGKRKDGSLFDVQFSASMIEDELGNPLCIFGSFIDITERKRTEMALRESEDKYRAIFESLHDVYYRTDRQGLVTIISPSVRSQAGYDPEDVIGHPVTDFYFHPSDREIFNTNLREAGIINDYELKLKAKDGRIIDVSTSSKIVFGKDGKPIGVEGILRDITERKRAEEAVQHAKKEWETTFDAIADWVCLIDPEHRILHTNIAGEKFVGLPIREIVGKKCFEVFCRVSKPPPNCILKKTLATHKRQLAEVISENGKRSFLVTTDPVLDKEDKPIAVVHTVHDITERKKAEKQLNIERTYLDRLFESAQEAILMTDREGNIIRVNNEFTRLFGYTLDEIIGRSIDDFIAPSDLHEEAVAATENITHGKNFSIESVRQTKDGNRINVSILGSPIVINEEIVGMYGIYRDITERKMAEDKIIASLKEKEVMLQEIHHRVKNNLQIISSLLRLQSRLIEDPAFVEMFKESQNRIQSMASIHEQLYKSKDYAKINFGTYAQNLIVHLFQTYAISPNKIEMETNTEDVLIDINNAIPCGLICNELVSNSIKHAFPEDKKGKIIFKLHSEKEGKVLILISDNGIGIPKEIDLQNPKTLGMQLVNDLIEQIKGTIELDRKGGTTWKIAL